MPLLPGGSGKAAQKDASGAAQREASELREQVWKLEQRVEHQSVLIHALFALQARSNDALTEAALTDQVRVIEQQRREAPPATCAKCHRVLGLRQAHCLYCGEPRTAASLFELT